MGPMGSIRSWPRDGDAGSLFKVGRVSPLRIQHDPTKIKIDLASVWGTGTIEHQLDAAYQSFF